MTAQNRQRKASHKRRKVGRPPGRAPRPRITLDNGDILIAKDEAAAELGMSRRTLTRMRVPGAKVAGIAYVSQRGLRKKIEDGITVPPNRRGR